MGCLVFLILAFIFRGAILAMLGAIVSVLFALVALLISLLSVGIWGLIILAVLSLIVAAFA